MIPYESIHEWDIKGETESFIFFVNTFDNVDFTELEKLYNVEKRVGGTYTQVEITNKHTTP